MLKKWTPVQLAATCCLDLQQRNFVAWQLMFEVGGNTCNDAFQLATQQCCVASCGNLLLVLLHRNHLFNKVIVQNGWFFVCCFSLFVFQTDAQTLLRRRGGCGERRRVPKDDHEAALPSLRPQHVRVQVHIGPSAPCAQVRAAGGATGRQARRGLRRQGP